MTGLQATFGEQELGRRHVHVGRRPLALVGFSNSVEATRGRKTSIVVTLGLRWDNIRAEQPLSNLVLSRFSCIRVDNNDNPCTSLARRSSSQQLTGRERAKASTKG